MKEQNVSAQGIMQKIVQWTGEMTGEQAGATSQRPTSTIGKPKRYHLYPKKR